MANYKVVVINNCKEIETCFESHDMAMNYAYENKGKLYQFKNWINDDGGYWKLSFDYSK